MPVRLPGVASEAVNKTDRRNRDKLDRSPGSYFLGRARELRLAAPYFLRNLREGRYGGTAYTHYHNLCGASYAAMLSAFEVMWKALYAGIVDAVATYDDNLVQHSHTRGVVTTESLLAHRSEQGAGGILASSLGTWQNSEAINLRYRAAFQIQPIANSDSDVVDQLWHVRYTVAHNSGVVGALEAYRLGSALKAGESLQIDEDYLKYAEKELVRIARAGVSVVGKRLLQDFFVTEATLDWQLDKKAFSRLYLLGIVVPKTKDLPTVTEQVYAKSKATFVP